MANIRRGTYEPSGDDIHVFDGAEDDDDVEGSRLPLLIVIALFVLAAFAGVVWLAYTQGVARGRSDVPRIIAAPAGPAKVAAAGTDGTGETPYKGLKIYEQPAPADEEADRQTAPPPANPDTTPPPMTAPDAVAAAPAPRPVELDKAPPAIAKPVAPPPPKAVEPPPEKTAALPASSPPAAEATAAPAQLDKKAAPVSSGAYVLQIGAYKSEEEADSAWRTYHAKHAGLLAGYAEDVKKVDLGDKGTWYRLRVGSFASKDSAKTLCDRLTADGGACFPAK